MKKHLLTLILLLAIGTGLKAQYRKFNVYYTNTVQAEGYGDSSLSGSMYSVEANSTYSEVLPLNTVHCQYSRTNGGYYCSTQTSGMLEIYNPMIFTPYNDSSTSVYMRVVGPDGYDETLLMEPYQGVEFQIPKGELENDDIYIYVFDTLNEE